MLGRKNYTREEFKNGKAAVAQQLALYKKFAGSVDHKQLNSTLDEFEHMFFNNMALVLDRYYVYRLRMVTGKEGSPLNEVELIADSLMNNAGIFRGNNVVKYVPNESLVKLKPGDQICLTAQDFERLSKAFFDELEQKYLT